MAHASALSAPVLALHQQLSTQPIASIERSLFEANLRHGREGLASVVELLPAEARPADVEAAAWRAAHGQVPALLDAIRMLPRLVEIVEDPQQPPLRRVILLGAAMYAGAPMDLVPATDGIAGFVDDAILMHRSLAALELPLAYGIDVRLPPHVYRARSEEELLLLQLALPADVVPILRSRTQAFGAQLAAVCMMPPVLIAAAVEQFMQPEVLIQMRSHAASRATQLPPPPPTWADPTANWSSEAHSFPDGSGGFARTSAGYFIWDS